MRARLVLQEDTALGQGPAAGQILPTLTHVPGSVLRGALAAAALAAGVDPRGTLFERLFEGEVHYGPAFAADPPLPLSVLQHKHGPTDRCERAAWDLAVEAGPQAPVCPDCDGPLEASKGTLTGPPMRTRMHVRLGPSGTAVEGNLFGRQVIDASSAPTLSGDLHGPRELLDELTAFPLLRIGGRLSSGGQARFELVDEPARGGPQRLHDGRIVVRTAAPTVLVDDLGRPRRAVSDDDWARLLGVPATTERAWTRWGTSGGWHAASGLPKPVDVVVAAGSTFLVRTEQPVPDETLSQLAERGLGLRRHEGYGALAPPPALPPTPAALQREQDQLRAHVDRSWGSVAPLNTHHGKNWLSQLIRELRDLADVRRATPGAPAPPTSVALRLLAAPPGQADAEKTAARFLLDVDDGRLLHLYLDKLDPGGRS